MIFMRSRAIVCALFVCALWGAWPGSAHAATTAGIRVREANLGADGTARVVVSVSGATRALTTVDFTVTENGAAVQRLAAAPLSEAAADAVSVVLVIDVSGSTAGAPLANAKSAAKAFIAKLPARTRIALVSFGASASTRVPFTADRARLSGAIDALKADGATAMYDGVVLASGMFEGTDASRSIVLFSDGKDTTSKATLPVALDAARRARAGVIGIGLETRDADFAALRALAQGTGGRSVRVTQSGDLTLAFREAAQDIASQYLLTYAMASRAQGDVQIGISVRIGSAAVSDQIVALAPAPGAHPQPGTAAMSPELPPAPSPLIPAFGSSVGLQVGIGAAALAIMLVGAIIAWRPRRSEAENVLSRGLRLYTRSAKERKAKRGGDREQSAFARAATGVIDRMPKPPRYEERLQARIDRAGWPFRAAEFLSIQFGGLVVGAIIGAVLFGKWWLAIPLGVVGASTPAALLRRNMSKRQSAFLEQLPDTLQLLAGSLQAGYGFMQAIDTLVKETSQPTASEFTRVLTEARLGMPVEDALNAMADRLGSEDFRWVVLAINIQRQVGGNLAMLLHTVADTLRERERVRRQIKVLSAEGKLSAYILGALPFGIAGYIMMVNPDYLDTMLSESLGRMMIGGALGMLGIGIVWMRKIIRIEV